MNLREVKVRSRRRMGERKHGISHVFYILLLSLDPLSLYTHPQRTLRTLSAERPSGSIEGWDVGSTRTDRGCCDDAEDGGKYE
jgi:hypothetical protein